jgi:hypothetical protein
MKKDAVTIVNLIFEFLKRDRGSPHHFELAPCQSQKVRVDRASHKRDRVKTFSPSSRSYSTGWKKCQLKRKNKVRLK